MSLTLLPSNALKIPLSQDYFQLRRLGMSYIEALGHRFWTDFNIHDPGVTILETLCYALSDLGYRTSLDTKDLILHQGYATNTDKQALYTARNILTNNPWTITDFRKWLIDMDGIRNAWLKVKNCPCEGIFLYGNEASGQLQYTPATQRTVQIKGLYDVLIEFDTDHATGDLNNGKIFLPFVWTFDTIGKRKGALELRFPTFQNIWDQSALYGDLLNEHMVVDDIDVLSISGNKQDNVDIDDNYLFTAMRQPLMVTILLKYHFSNDPDEIGHTLQLNDVPMQVWVMQDEAKRALKVDVLRHLLTEMSNINVMRQYILKLSKAKQVLETAKMSLHETRNLCEDWCEVRAIAVEDIAVCADIEVAPDADIEQTLAMVYYVIEQYLSPRIPFYSLHQLLENGYSVDDIFNGPALTNGFLLTEDVEDAQLKEQLYVSDLIHLIMSVKGVLSVNNLLLTGYDAEGFKTQTEDWIYQVKYNHQPRLYRRASKFLIFKNGLTFLPDLEELNDCLQMIEGLNMQVLPKDQPLDLLVPKGIAQDIEAYYPVQYQLPQTYGVSPFGLPPKVGKLREAQAAQLKGYLLFFEQFFVNYLAQLKNAAKLFDVSKSVEQTYFGYLLSSDHYASIHTLVSESHQTQLAEGGYKALLEDEATFLDRRNRFLDHILARFAESFSDYALMLYSLNDQKFKSQQQLINDKIAFIKALPLLSRNRGKAFNYKKKGGINDRSNASGLAMRIERILGMNGLEPYFEFYEEKDEDNVFYEVRWRFKDDNGNILLSSSTRYPNDEHELAVQLAKEEIESVIDHVLDVNKYTITFLNKWTLNLVDDEGEVIATRKQAFDTEQQAIDARDAIIEFAKHILLGNKVLIVEHVLLRPRNLPSVAFPNGDRLLQNTGDDCCEACAEVDPYSFQMSIILSGEYGLSGNRITFRRFAEQAIRQEVPAHLSAKICWVSNEQLQVFEAIYSAWLEEMSNPEPDKNILHDRLHHLINALEQIKSVYPEAYLHDCVDGNDENRVYLNQTII